MTPELRVLVATTVPVLAAVGGAFWAATRSPSRQVRSAIQHFAAGLVFAVAATELIPDLRREHEPLPVIIGFSVGIAAMLGLGMIGERPEARGRGSFVALAVVGVDVFVDGILIGIGFAEGGSAGPLLAVALTVELLGLGVALAISLQESDRARPQVVRTVGATSSLIVLGGLLGTTLLSDLAPMGLSAVLAFATVALLYLVTEELLSEAHETPDTPLLTMSFFVGFLLILLLSFST